MLFSFSSNCCATCSRVSSSRSESMCILLPHSLHGMGARLAFFICHLPYRYEGSAATGAGKRSKTNAAFDKNIIRKKAMSGIVKAEIA